MTTPFYRKNPTQDELQRTLGGPRPGVSDTMPVNSGLPVRQGIGMQAPNPPPPVQPSVSRGFTPKYAMEGFDFAREQNTGKSAKDAFASLSNQAPPPPLQDKAALGAWFNQYIKPGMDALGHKVSDVQGDKFRFKNWQGDYWVDYGRGAGAQGGALAWQADDANAPTQAAQGQGQRTQGSVLPGQSDLWAEIMASLQAQQDPQALLLEQLR